MIIRIRTPLAANGTASVLSGSLFEFVDSPSTVEIGVCADATGVLLGINSGPDTLLEADSPAIVKTINLNPTYPDDFVSDEALAGDRLSIKVRDTTGAARVVMTELRIAPLG
jgi:hypothetical protein